jgi:monovalent cation/hydrogen antiporter
MQAQSLFVQLILVGAICSLTLLARRIPIAGPVLMTIGGIVLGFIPWFPNIRLDPDCVLLVVLPPLVYSAAVQLPWDDFRDNARPISLFAVALVAVTILAVAAGHTCNDPEHHLARGVCIWFYRVADGSGCQHRSITATGPAPEIAGYYAT